MSTYELEWLIGVGIGALIIGLLIGLVLGQTLFRSKKTRDVEQELETAQEALKDYRAEVYDQFAETARKFDTLNDSYNDLHRHLASSANTLLGDGMSAPLLRGPAEPAAAAATSAAETVDPIEGHATVSESAATAATDNPAAPGDAAADAPAAPDPVAANSTATESVAPNPTNTNKDEPAKQ